MRRIAQITPILIAACLMPTLVFGQASALNNAVSNGDSMVASVPNPDQEAEVRRKLGDLHGKTGKRHAETFKK